MTQHPPIFVITGVPGAGKSTVAAELMRRFAFGIHVPVDDMRELVVAGSASPVPEFTEEARRQFGLARAAAGQIARIYNDAGFAVALDDVLGPADAEEAWGELLVGRDLRHVLLAPDLDTALGRNAMRAGKPFDPAVLVDTIRRLHGLNAPAAYAAYGWRVIDNSALTLEQTVDQILQPAMPASDVRARPVDQHGVLADEIFSYRASKEKVFITWHGKPVMTLKGKEAARFLSKIDGLEGQAAQLVMAKITGNFKRGNER